jgi:hypothetical protein
MRPGLRVAQIMNGALCRAFHTLYARAWLPRSCIATSLLLRSLCRKQERPGLCLDRPRSQQKVHFCSIGQVSQKHKGIRTTQHSSPASPASTLASIEMATTIPILLMAADGIVLMSLILSSITSTSAAALPPRISEAPVKRQLPTLQAINPSGNQGSQIDPITLATLW